MLLLGLVVVCIPVGSPLWRHRALKFLDDPSSGPHWSLKVPAVGVALSAVGAVAFLLAARGRFEDEDEDEDAMPRERRRAKKRSERAASSTLRCPACGRLNEDDSKFCQECGKPLGRISATGPERP